MQLDGHTNERGDLQATEGQKPCAECANLKIELHNEREERRNLADENRQLYRRCLELERQNGELRLALQAAGGESDGTDVPSYVQSALTSIRRNDD